jgi:hypothetical protein
MTMSKNKVDSSADAVTALAPIGNFAVLRQDATSIAEALAENLGGEQVGPSDLDRIRIPAGGGTSWTVPTINGEEDAKEFTGVIVGIKTVRSFWQEEFSGEGNPPDCYSDDGVVGHGDPGVACASCPLNVFGSAKGAGKACKERRLLFVLRENDFLPVVVALPPASIQPFKKFLMRLSSQGLPYSSVVTSFTLEKDKNSGGIVFSKAKLGVAGVLSSEEAATVRAYAETIRPLLARVRDEQTASEAVN